MNLLYCLRVLGFNVSKIKSIIRINIVIMHSIPMKIVLCNHAKNNKTNKYNGTNNNIVYNYNII